MPLACLRGCPNQEPQREGRGEGRLVLGRGFSPSCRSLWGSRSLLPSEGQSHESVARAVDSPERHTGEQNSVGTNEPDGRGTVFSWLARWSGWSGLRGHGHWAWGEPEHRSLPRSGGAGQSLPRCRGSVSSWAVRNAHRGRQGTRLLVLEVGPRWKRQRVLRPVLAGGGCRRGASPYSSSGMATGPRAGLSRGRWRSLWTLPVGTQPQSRSRARGQSRMCTSPCCLPPPQGSGLCREGLRICARPGAPAYVCCTCNSCLIRMANKLQKQLICAAAHTPRSCGSAAWLAAVPPCVPSQWSEHSRSVPPSAQVLKFWLYCTLVSIAPGKCCSGFDKMITIALLKPLK